MDRGQIGTNMRTYIKTYDLSKVWPPSQVLDWCDKNNFSKKCVADGKHHSSLIRKTLKECLKGDTGTLILAHNGTSYVGWGLSYNLSHCNNNEFQCYVPHHKRRMGIGSKMLAKACSIDGRVEIYDIDTSEGFYKANGMTANEAITGKRLKKTK